MTVYSVNVFQCKKSQILATTLPENAQDSLIYYFHSHLKTTVKFHITVFCEVTEYKTPVLGVTHYKSNTLQ